MPEKVRILNIAESAHGGLGTYFSLIVDHGSERFAERFLIPDRHSRMVSAAARVRTFRHSGRNPVTIFRMVASVFSEFRSEPPDVSIFHAFFSIPALLLARVAYPSVPRIYIPHGWTTQQFRRNSLGWRLADLCERFACRLANRCVTVSVAELNFARDNGMPGTYRLVMNAAAARSLRPVENGEPRQSDDVRLLYVGRLDRQKGVDLLLRAYADAVVANPALRLRIIGEAARGKRDAARPASFPESYGVEFLGWQPRDKLDDHYAWADALIAPSRWEAFGFVVPEAARHGTPSIASDRGGLPEAVKSSGDGIIFHLSEDEDIRPLTEVLMAVSGEDLKRMRANILAKEEPRRSAAAMVSELERVIDELLS